ISGVTGTKIYQTTHKVAITPYTGTAVNVELMVEGDISGDGKNDIAMVVSGQTTENDTLSYSYALNGTDGTAMWYTVVNSTYGEQTMILGLGMFGAMYGVPSAQCDLNGNGLSDDAAVGTSNAIFIVYTIPGSPVEEKTNSVLIPTMIVGVTLLTIIGKTRKEEKI
ncbi:MAG: hypothetical protein QXH13_03815, partial [Thermoplasmata archaeon]